MSARCFPAELKPVHVAAARLESANEDLPRIGDNARALTRGAGVMIDRQ